ncbi:MAG: sigma-54 dependent transcriptional regulator [Pseudomonadota bacterium]
MNEARILFVDDEAHLRHAVKQGLGLSGYDVACFASADDALEQIGRALNGVLVTDIKMPKTDGLTLMRRALEIDPALPVVLVTGHGDVPLAVEAMRGGAYDFIEKPFDMTHLADVVARALEKRRLVLENRLLREELGHGTGLETVIVGRARATERLRREVEAVAAADVDTLIIGDTGAGKELVARALHDFSQRKAGPFVALNCGALPAEIIESELFGHEAGAFTGAVKQRIGKLEHANGGTVLLDEIESMPLDLQVKLLRVIEGRSLERLGSNQTLPIDVRFLAATKADLEEESRQGKFREDLVYRLNVVSIRVPSLAERLDDIPLLFQHLAREARARYRREIPPIGPEVVATLMARDWPGNVRELRNAADRFVLGLEPPAAAGQPSGGSLAEQVGAFEKSLLQAELAKQGGSMKATYQALGLSRKTLYDKLQKHGIARSVSLEDG